MAGGYPLSGRVEGRLFQKLYMSPRVRPTVDASAIEAQTVLPRDYSDGAVDGQGRDDHEKK